MRGISCLVSPIADHAFFKQPKLQRLLGDNLLQFLRLTPQILDLAAGRSTRRIARKPSLAGFQELLRPAVIKALGNSSRRQSSAIECSPRSPSSTTRIFSSADYCLRVARRMFFTSRSDDESNCPDFCLISTPGWLR